MQEEKETECWNIKQWDNDRSTELDNIARQIGKRPG